MTLQVVRPGMLSTFQDLGRVGLQHLGVPVAGAMDERAHRLANLLAGNPPELATIEITMTGPTLRAQTPCCFAISGADLSPTINGHPIPLNRPLIMRAGDEVAFGERRNGTRCYLAVHGGFDLEPVLGSTSTYLRSAIGPWHGRALRRGDELGLRRTFEPGRNNRAITSLAMALSDIEIYLPAPVAQAARRRVRVVKSAQWREFTPESCVAFLTGTFRISPDSERMGYRLQGPELSMTHPRQMLSEATTFGTIQVPSGGQPIVLMADRQTTGGYPKLAYVASVDLPLLAQLGPGDNVQFEAIPLEAAQQLDLRRARAFVELAAALEPIKTMLTNH